LRDKNGVGFFRHDFRAGGGLRCNPEGKRERKEKLEDKEMPLENILLLALAIIGIYEGGRLAKVTLLFDDPVGPGWYLFFLSALLFICAIALIVRQMRRKTGSQGGFSVLKGPAGQSLLLLLFYALAASFAGYLLGSVVFFVLAQRIFGERSWPRSAAFGLAITGSFYLIFSYLAGVPFP
jgi:hypothetical protein